MKAANKKIGVRQIAEAEKILNRTLAYQAAIAVHELKERLDLNVAELRLVVKPADPQTDGTYRVTCYVVEMNAAEPLAVEVLVRPDGVVVSQKRTRRPPGSNETRQ